jgi:hypothetical protein
MPMTAQQTQDAANALFWAAWQAASPALNGGAVARVEWDAVGDADLKDKDDAFARVKFLTLSGRQTSFGPPGGRRFTNNFAVSVEIYVPRGRGRQIANGLAQIAVDAFEGVALQGGDAFFTGVYPKEAGAYANFWEIDVAAYGQYTSLA